MYGEREVGDRTFPHGLSPHPNSVRHVGERLIRLACNYLATWSWISAVRDRLAMGLAQSDRVLACELMAGVHSPNVKTQALANAVEEIRPGDGGLVKWALNQLRGIEKYRDRFAHDLWIGVRDEPDMLILIQTKHLSAHHAANRSLVREQIGPGAWRSPLDDATRDRLFWTRRGVIYTEAILRDMLRDAVSAHFLMDAVEMMLTNWHPAAVRPGEFGDIAGAARSQLEGFRVALKQSPGRLASVVPQSFPEMPR